ncbi:MAG TPA: class I SAM-dependent methyltransferase [Stellaceae bacterium]|nr:class I SAM-dependent methyltransferase [Stellaceae bacterium]
MTGKPDKAKRDAAEAAVRSCYAGWAENYFADYYASEAAYPPVHQKLVRDLVRDSGARTLLDAGCGPASMLRSLAELDIALYGFDLTPEMVAEARRVMAARGAPKERIWQGSVADAGAFRAPCGPDRFDAAICIGVLPHVPAALDETVIANLRGAVRPGGLVVLEARNQLFALFTLNRYSHEFFLGELVRADLLRERAGSETARLDEALAQLAERFRTDLPPPRRGKAGEPGYDEVLSRTHNPLLLRERFAAAGFSEVQLLFYHFHCLPPMLEPGLPALFRRQSLAMEDPTDWRGYFMASAFLLAGRRA